MIFVGVFGTMFYSLCKHRKSVGHQAAQFHENTTVEIVWTVIPFLILLFMAYPATKTILAMHDTSAPDMTIKVTGYQWKWNYDYLQEGFGFYSNAHDAARADRGPRAEGRALPARGRQSAGRARRRQGARARHRRRRDPRVVGAGVRRQAGRDSRLRPRHVVPRRQGRHLPRPVRRAVRQGARLHADRRRGEVEGRLREVARRAEAEARRRRRRSEQGLGREGPRRARPAGVRRQLRGLPSADRHGQRRDRRAGARRRQGRARPAAAPDRRRAERPDTDGKPTAMPSWKPAVRRRHRVGDHLHAQQLGQQGGRERRPAGRTSKPSASKEHS